MPRTNSSNEYEQRILANIQRSGWQCTSVGAGEGSPCFSYTIGLFHSFGFPELIVLGLRPSTAYGMLKIAADAARAGNPLNLTKPSDALLEGYQCEFVPVPSAAYGQYVLSASWYYEAEVFPVHQVVWPSEEGMFPWDATADAGFRATQPVLGSRVGGR
ncbi:MAG TPA: DUF4262 domain-containing protein [Steroidobacteraceae bacterium]|nr:DUF4262 domain-containing protein [Steroidobacteraceae bacterium]